MQVRNLFLILSTLFIFAIFPVSSKDISLGKARVYKSYQADENIELILVSLGEKKSELILVSYKIPGYQFDGKSYVYSKNCETTRCQKIFLTQLGGSSINLISEQGYFGNYYEVTLPDRNNKIALYYDQKSSANKSADAIFAKHLKSIYRFAELNTSKAKISEAHNKFKKSCQSKSKLEIKANEFQKNSQTSLVGMAAHYLDQLSLFCGDTMYKEVFSEIGEISIVPSVNHKEFTLSDSNKLTIYLSDDIYNPSVQANTTIEKL